MQNTYVPSENPQGSGSPATTIPDTARDASLPVPPRVPLTRERVLEAALRLVDEEGLDALTRRRLGQELGRDAMTLYRYAPDQAALLDGIVELVLDELVIPDDGQDWQTQLRRGAHNFRQLALAHPHMVGLIVTRPMSTPLGLRPLGTLRPLENLLEFLTTAGFSRRSRCRSTASTSASCTGTSSPSSRRSWSPRRDRRPAAPRPAPPAPRDFHCSAAWPQNWPIMTEPPSSTRASTSSSPASTPPAPKRLCQQWRRFGRLLTAGTPPLF